MSNHKEVQNRPQSLSNLYFHPGPGKNAWLQRLFAFIPGISIPETGIIRDPDAGKPTHNLFRLGYHPLRAGQSVLCKLNLNNKDLSYSNLEGINFKRALMKNTNFSGASLSQSNLKHCDMENALLSDTDLRGADLSGANLRNARLINCQLQGANLKNADLTGAHLEGMLFDEDINLQGCQLSGSHLRDTNFYGTDLSLVRFTESQLQEVVMQDCKLDTASFERSKLLHVLIDNCHDQNPQEGCTSFRGTEIKQSTIQHCSFNRGDFFSSRITDSKINNSQFYFGLFMTTVFTRCAINQCAFAALSEIPEKQCDFFKATFDDCIIQNCDFQGAQTNTVALKNMRETAVTETLEFAQEE